MLACELKPVNQTANDDDLPGRWPSARTCAVHEGCEMDSRKQYGVRGWRGSGAKSPLLRGVERWKVEGAGSIGFCGVGLQTGVAGRLTADIRGRGEPGWFAAERIGRKRRREEG